MGISEVELVRRNHDRPRQPLGVPHQLAVPNCETSSLLSILAAVLKERADSPVVSSIIPGYHQTRQHCHSAFHWGQGVLGPAILEPRGNHLELL